MVSNTCKQTAAQTLRHTNGRLAKAEDHVRHETGFHIELDEKEMFSMNLSVENEMCSIKSGTSDQTSKKNVVG